jgi:hypothetical protein
MAEYQNDEAAPRDEPAADDGLGSRRSFLVRSAAAGVTVPGLVLATATSSEGAPKKNPPPSLGVSQQLITILIKEIRNDEAAHVPILQKKLMDEDNPLNPKVRTPPIMNMARIIQPNVRSFLATAAAFENTGSGTYGGALFAVQQTDEYFRTAVGLCTVESRHAAFLNALLGDALVPNFVPVEAPIDQDVTLSRVQPFILSPGPSGFPEFDPLHASDPNNFRILDFLLFLEYIESFFYNFNVPRLFH